MKKDKRKIGFTLVLASLAVLMLAAVACMIGMPSESVERYMRLTEMAAPTSTTQPFVQPEPDNAVLLLPEPTLTAVPTGQAVTVTEDATCETWDVNPGDEVTETRWGFVVLQVPQNDTIMSGVLAKAQLPPGSYRFTISGQVTFCVDQTTALNAEMAADGEISALMNLVDLKLVEIIRQY